MPEDRKGVEVLGIVSEVKREGQGEYVMPSCTVFGLKQEEVDVMKKEGLKLADENRNIEGIEVHGASAFKIMRVLCSKAGWSTSGEPVATTVCEGKPSFMWTLTRKCEVMSCHVMSCHVMSHQYRE